MRFSTLLTLASSVALVAAQTAFVVVGNIKAVTTLSGNLKDVTKSINAVNVLFVGPKVAAGFTGITNTVATAMSQMSVPPPVFPDSDAQQIVVVLKAFVKVHQELLNIVIGKHGLLSLFFFAEPVRLALVALEDIVDDFALALIDMIPTQSSAAQTQFAALGGTIGGAITIYTKNGPI